jgi:uncharacterized protein (UPF0210 family)
MTNNISRREFVSLVGMGLALPITNSLGTEIVARNYRIRTITAGVNFESTFNLDQAKAAVSFLKRSREAFVARGYEVQTLRIATQALQKYLPDWISTSSLRVLKTLDQFAVDSGVVCSIGPVITTDEYHQGFAEWAAELVQQTKNISFTCQVASADQGVHYQAVRTAAETIHTLAQATPGGEGNFRFAATGFIPSGTPFFPAAYFNQGNTFSIGLETPNLLTEAFEGELNLQQAKQRLKTQLENALGKVEQLGRKLGDQSGWSYLGIDASPAPGLDASIGKAIETLTHAPFGSPSTLAGCAAITDVLKGLSVETCGYSGLMLPVLEDPVLAKRAAEGLFSVSELLLYSSVCGTGLDVVPLPGDTSVDALAALITDVAALSTKYSKPLSARLFPIPNRHAGDMVSFDNPFLTKSIVMSPD